MSRGTNAVRRPDRRWSYAGAYDAPIRYPYDELDPAIRPQDDLFRHVNGRWIAQTTIGADRARDSTFRILADQAENAVREIVAEAVSAPEGTEERKFGDLYASFMDTGRAELLGAQPISQALAAARAVSSIPELLETLGRLQPLGVGGLYRLIVDTDPGHPERYLVLFEQAGISLPDESYYREERFAGVRGAFAGHVQRMFELAGLPDAEGAARRVLALEAAVAGHDWEKVASREREKTYNLFTWAGVLSQGPDLRQWRRPWTRPLAPSTRSCSASRASAPGWPRRSPTSTFRRGGTGCAGG